MNKQDICIQIHRNNKYKNDNDKKAKFINTESKLFKSGELMKMVYYLITTDN